MPPPPPTTTTTHFRTIILRICSGIHDRSTSNKNIGLKISPPTELFRKLICFGRVTLPLVKDGGFCLTNHGMEKVKAFALGLVIEMSAMQKSATPSITSIIIMKMMINDDYHHSKSSKSLRF